MTPECSRSATRCARARSADAMAATRPYSEAFASSTASSSDLNVVIGATGPKIFLVEGRHAGSHAGEHDRLEKQSVTRAAGQRFRAFGECVRDNTIDIGGLAFIDDRPELDRLIKGIADNKRLGLSRKRFGVRAADSLMDEVA